MTVRARPAAPQRPTRERILDAACDVIAESGIDDVRIARIATLAGVSPALVHYHFDTREALLGQALEHSFDLVGDLRRRTRTPPAGPPESGWLDDRLLHARPRHGRARLEAVGGAVAARRPPARAAPGRRPALCALPRVVRRGGGGGDRRRANSGGRRRRGGEPPDRADRRPGAARAAGRPRDGPRPRARGDPRGHGADLGVPPAALARRRPRPERPAPARAAAGRRRPGARRRRARGGGLRHRAAGAARPAVRRAQAHQAGRRPAHLQLDRLHGPGRGQALREAATASRSASRTSTPWRACWPSCGRATATT